MKATLFTPTGESIKPEELEEQERIECPGCHLAVLEEYIPCEDCESGWCLYCWEEGNWICPNCGNLHHSMGGSEIGE